MDKIATFTDNFTTANLTKWSGYGGGVTVSAGRLSIVPSSAYDGISSKDSYDFTSSHIMVQLVQPPSIGNGSISAGFGVEVSEGNTEEFIVENGILYCSEKVGGASSSASVTYDPVAHAWLQIREQSGTVYWETSPDSTAWTVLRSKALGIPAPTAVTIGFYAGFWGTEPSPGIVLFDNLNTPIVPPVQAEGWVVGRLSFGGKADPVRPFFAAADWLWEPIPDSPVLHANSGTWAGYLGAGGTYHSSNLDEFGNALVIADEVTESTPRYAVELSHTGEWGPNPLDGYLIPIPLGTQDRVAPNYPDGDNHLAVVDPVAGKVFSIWQAKWTGSTWTGSWGGVADLEGDGVVYAGSATAAGISTFAGCVHLDELQAAAAANTGIGRALMFSSDICAPTVFVPPAIKTDGINMAGVATPMPQGYRVQLDPSLDVDSIFGITSAERVIAKTLQTHGAYCVDNGGSRMAFAFERQSGGDIAPYGALGLEWDYYNLNKIPWSSLRVLQKWDGSA